MYRIDFTALVLFEEFYGYIYTMINIFFTPQMLK